MLARSREGRSRDMCQANDILWESLENSLFDRDNSATLLLLLLLFGGEGSVHVHVARTASLYALQTCVARGQQS